MSEGQGRPRRAWPWPVGAAVGVGAAALVPAVVIQRSAGGIFDFLLALWGAPAAALTAGLAGAGLARVQRVAADTPALAGAARVATTLGVATLLASAGWLARGWSATPWVEPMTVTLPVFSVLCVAWLGATVRLSRAAAGLSVPHAGLMWLLVLQTAAWS